MADVNTCIADFKFKLDKRQISSKHTNSWKWNNALLNDEWVKGKKFKKKVSGTKWKQNTMQQSLWDALKEVLQRESYSSNLLYYKSGKT